jgi:hypothetical protein
LEGSTSIPYATAMIISPAILIFTTVSFSSQIQMYVLSEMIHEILRGMQQSRKKGLRSGQFGRLVFANCFAVECSVEQPAMCTPEENSIL